MPITVVRANIASTSAITGTQLAAIVCSDFAVMEKLSITPITDWARR
jgi:hypothetical protein